MPVSALLAGVPAVDVRRGERGRILLSVREVGDRLGTPLATAANRIRRGKARLRTLATLTGFPMSRPA
jgi:hypothetical protein